VTNAIEDYFADFQHSVHTRATADGSFSREAFALEAAERLSLADEIDSLSTYSIETTGSRGKRIAIDGSDLNDEENQVVLAIADFRPGNEIETLTTTDAKRIFSSLEAFAQSALDGSYTQVFDPSTQAFQDSEEIEERHRSGRLDKMRLYLISNARLSDKIKSFPSSNIAGVETEFHIWGLDRFHRVESSELGRDEIEIDLREWSVNGLTALEASTPGSEVETLLLVVPGEILANIYDRYGSRVLESNVRSFLTNRVKVNKGMQGTLLQSPELFLPYNNGVTATASEITSTVRGGTRVITAIRDLQIVNGGQTTASLYFARRNEGIDLSRAFVQMKLMVVAESLAQDLVPKISRYANTQNKVSESDFFSNHAFHQRMEEKSRRILTPKRAGEHHETKWFYERTRGQYLNEKNKLSVRNSRKFEIEYPKTQVINKTDAAKYLVTWDQKPNVVRTGAQKNFVVFANLISSRWEKSDLEFDDRYFRDLVSKGILFKAVEVAVSNSDWYRANAGYRADIVTYAIARFAFAVSEVDGGAEFDFEGIWRRQAVPDEILDEILELAESVREVLVDPSRPVTNVTEWAKRPLCWERVKEIPFDFPPELKGWLLSVADARERKASGRKMQKIDNSIDAQREVIELGAPYWVRLRDFGRQMGKLSDTDLSFIAYATGERGKLASEKQSIRLIEIRDRLVDLGFEAR
jgi:hypothetical protein